MGSSLNKMYLCDTESTPTVRFRSDYFGYQDMKVDKAIGTVRDASFSPDGFTVAFATSAGLKVYDSPDGDLWTQRTGVPTVSTYLYGVTFSPDGSQLSVNWSQSTNREHRVYSTTDWTYRSPIGYLYDKAETNYLFKSLGVFFVDHRVYDNYANGWQISTKSWVDGIDFGEPTESKATGSFPAPINSSNEPGGYVYDMALNAAGTVLIAAHNYDGYLTTWDATDVGTATLSQTSILSSQPEGHANSLDFSPDDSMLLVGHDGGSYFSIYDTTTWDRIIVPTLSSHETDVRTSMATVTSTGWIDNTLIWLFTNDYPNCYEYNLTTKKFRRVDNEPEQVFSKYDEAPLPLYEVTGTIDESTQETQWVVTARDYITGQPVARQWIDSPDTTFSIGLYNKDRVLTVTVAPRYKEEWETYREVELDWKVIPTDALSTPYYFKVTVAGQCGEIEPIWTIVPGSTVEDGEVTWECVERIIQPVTQAPLYARAKP